MRSGLRPCLGVRFLARRRGLTGSSGGTWGRRRMTAVTELMAPAIRLRMVGGRLLWMSLLRLLRTRRLRIAHRAVCLGRNIARTTTRERSGNRGRRRSNVAVIHRRQQSMVACGGLFVPNLNARRLNMLLMRERLFLRRRPRLYPVRSIETYVTVVRHRNAIHISVVDNVDVHVGHRRVIPEPAAFPHAPEESNAAVAKAVIHPAIETDVRTPVPGVPAIEASAPTPISRRPEHADLRRH